MIAPSPDWCAVASDVDLRDGGGWVKEKTVTLYPWDMGTDKATTYRAFDDDQQPRGAVQRATRRTSSTAASRRPSAASAS